MKSYLFLLSSLLFIISCQPSTKQQDGTTEQSATDNAAGAPQQGLSKGNIYVQKITDYSPQFVANMQHAANDIPVVSMLGNRLVTKGGDTLYFPSMPPIGQELVFTGGKTGQKVELRVERVNQSTLRYGVVVELAEGGTFEEKNLADLTPLFFLGAESDEDDQTGLSYLTSEFTDPASECHNSIRIGQIEGESGYVARLIMDCYDMPMSLEESPTLRAK